MMFIKKINFLINLFFSPGREMEMKDQGQCA